MKKKAAPIKLKKGDVIKFVLDHPATNRGIIVAEDGDAYDIIGVKTGKRKKVKKSNIDVVDKRTYASRYVKDIRGDKVVFEFYNTTYEINLEEGKSIGRILVYTTTKEMVEGVVSEKKDTGFEVYGFDGNKYFVKNNDRSVRPTNKKVFTKVIHYV